MLRVGDKLNATLTIPPLYKERITGVHKYYTKPKLEMLLIIAEGKRHEYEKSRLTPKQFAKSHIKLGCRKYDNSTQFYIDYFSQESEKLVAAILEYKRI